MDSNASLSEATRTSRSSLLPTSESRPAGTVWNAAATLFPSLLAAYSAADPAPSWEGSWTNRSPRLDIGTTGDMTSEPSLRRPATSSSRAGSALAGVASTT